MSTVFGTPAEENIKSVQRKYAGLDGGWFIPLENRKGFVLAVLASENQKTQMFA